MVIQRTRKLFFFLACALVSIVLWTMHTNTTHAAGEVAPYTQTEIIQATNKARLAKDLGVLKMNPKLNFAAQLKANDMVNQKYFGHIAPKGTHYSSFITLAGYSYKNAGENLAFRYKTVDALLKTWLVSDGHRANILSKQYTDVGIGMAYGERNGKKGWYVVELFGSAHKNQILTLK